MRDRTRRQTSVGIQVSPPLTNPFATDVLTRVSVQRTLLVPQMLIDVPQESAAGYEEVRSTYSSHVLVWNDFHILHMPCRFKDLTKDILRNPWIQPAHV